DLLGDPPKHEPPRDDGADSERCRRGEHAARHGQPWKQGVDRRENEQRDAERLQRADEKLGAVFRDMRVVVQIAVVEADLTNRRDDERLWQHFCTTVGHACPPTRKYALAATAPVINALSDMISVVDLQ